MTTFTVWRGTNSRKGEVFGKRKCGTCKEEMETDSTAWIEGFLCDPGSGVTTKWFENYCFGYPIQCTQFSPRQVSLSYSCLKQLPYDFRGVFFHRIWPYPVSEIGARTLLQVRKTAKSVQIICLFRVSFINYYGMETALNSYTDMTQTAVARKCLRTQLKSELPAGLKEGKAGRHLSWGTWEGKINIDAASRKCHHLLLRRSCMLEGLKAL